MKKSSKRHVRAQEVGDLKKEYQVDEAVELLNNMPKARFDETVSVSVHLGVDPKQSDQMVRGTVSLPNGSGKTVRVLAFTEDADGALKSGADFAGLHDMIEKISGGWLGFDVAVATTSAMKEVRSVARILGPRGMMPNPKTGTVTDNLEEAIGAVKAGRVEFKMDKSANLSIVVGKASFSQEKLSENIEAAIDVLSKLRPLEFKGKFIKSMSLSATMSPGVRLSPKIYSKF
ncbi:MAG: 50S ribosomal protein L1 [Puniceicoccales bacterium]|jgi:large subunit ribosomal protein L1|nr:50S ribosomal protein L1 [Puniceicoccales bacterium]